MVKRRVHRVMLQVTFDKPCSETTAVREARECLKDAKHYTADIGQRGYPREFKVRTVQRLKARTYG